MACLICSSTVDAVWRLDLDVASSDANALCPERYTPEQDGLAQCWEGRRVWRNPPYGRDIAPWVDKARRESEAPGTVVVMLLPARTDTAWWQHDVIPHATEVSFLRGRLRFLLGGVPQGPAPFPSALVRFGGSLPTQAPATGGG